MRPLLPLLLLACTDPPPADEVPTESEPPIPPVDYTPPEPAWSAAETLAAMEEGLTIGLPEGEAMTEGWQRLVDHGDGTCPGPKTPEETVGLGEGAAKGCVAASGWSYFGIGSVSRREVPEEHRIECFMIGEMEALGPSGERFAAGGHWDYVYEGPGETRFFRSHVEGSWIDTDGHPAVAAGLSAYVDLQAAFDATNRAGMVDGALSVGDIALAFDQFSVDQARCDDVPYGGIGVRDPSGTWTWLVLPDTCETPCGALVNGDQVLGEDVCIDGTLLVGALGRAVRW